MRARDVPALVLAHQEALLSQQWEVYAEDFFAAALRVRNQHYEPWQIKNHADHWRKEEHDRLNISVLFHVTESMLEVAKMAAQKLDPDEIWNGEILPARTGFISFEQPLYIRDAWQRMVGISAFSWYIHQDGNITLHHYTDPDDMGDEYNRSMATDPDQWKHPRPLVLGHLQAVNGTLGKWMTGDEPEVLRYREAHGNQAQVDQEIFKDFEPVPYTVPSFSNTHLILYAIFALMDQSIVSLSEETNHKLARRNRNKRRPPAMVTVIQLRRKESHGQHDQDSGRFLLYRSETRAHWRKQRYGPGRTEVKRIWILKYERGPEGAPFLNPKRVSSLSR
jgi:hypothetical protein